jgi:hypothetical protein
MACMMTKYVIDVAKVRRELKMLHATNPRKTSVREFLKQIKSGSLDNDGKFSPPMFPSQLVPNTNTTPTQDNVEHMSR